MPDDAREDAAPRVTDPGFDVEAYVQSALPAPSDEPPAETAPTSGDTPGHSAPAPEAPPTDAGDAATRQADAARHAAQVPPPDAPIPTQPTAGEVPPGEEPAATAEPEPGPAASYRADGGEHQIPGSEVGDDGVFIPTQQWSQVQRLLARGHGSHRQIAERDRQAAQWRNVAEAAQAARDTVFQKLDELHKAGDAAAFAREFTDKWPIWRAEGQASEAQRLADAREAELQQYRQQQEAAALVPQLESQLEEALRYALAQEAYKDLDAKLVWSRLHPLLTTHVFMEADYDIPDQGIRAGQAVLNAPFVRAVLDDEVTRLSQYQQMAKQVTRATAAQPKPSAAPPTVAATGPAPSAEPKHVRPKTRAEAERAIDHIIEHAQELIP